MEVQQRPKNITLIRLSEREGLLESPEVVSAGSTSLIGNTEISQASYRKEVQQRFNIKPVDEVRHEQLTANSELELSGGIPVDISYLYASEQGLLMSFNTFGQFDAEANPDFVSKVKSCFERIALATGGFVEFHQDKNFYDMEVWFPEFLLDKVNTFDEHKEWAASDCSQWCV